MNDNRNRLHSNKGYLNILILIMSITIFHIIIQLLHDDIPQIFKYFYNPSNNYLLESMYIGDNGQPLSYFFRNHILRYAIYPMLLFTFIIDRYHLENKLRFINWKTLIILLILVAGFIILFSKPYLDGINRWPYYLLYQIGFENSSAAIYVYSLILWISLIVICFKFFDSKLAKHHAIWLTGLVFLSIEEVWQYAVYIQYYYIQSDSPLLALSSLQIFSLYLWRGIPTILLVYYAFRYRFSLKKNLFYISLLISSLASLTLILFPQYNMLGVFLRIIWFITYILFVYSLNIHKFVSIEVKEN